METEDLKYGYRDSIRSNNNFLDQSQTMALNVRADSMDSTEGPAYMPYYQAEDC